MTEVNAVRKHVSTLKGGKLARLAAPAATLALLLSDVVGDPPHAIASGLTAPDPTTLQQARDVLKRYRIKPPESVTEQLAKGEETPKPGDTLFEGVVERRPRRRAARGGLGRGEGTRARLCLAPALHHIPERRRA